MKSDKTNSKCKRLQLQREREKERSEKFALPLSNENWDVIKLKLSK